MECFHHLALLLPVVSYSVVSMIVISVHFLIDLQNFIGYVTSFTWAKHFDRMQSERKDILYLIA